MTAGRFGGASLGLVLLLCPYGCAAHDPQTISCDASSSAITEQPQLPGAVDVTVRRLVPGCDAVLVSSGIPLAAGMLTASQLSQVRLFVGGKEQALYVEALQGAHPDGTLRSVLVQFKLALNFDAPVVGQLLLGQARGTADIPKPSGSRTSAAAVVLPTDPSYLVSTQIVGPTLTAASASQVAPTVQRYETDFETYADKHWHSGGAAWEENYYDRALIYYAWWVRTGNAEYWKRATALAVNYRKDYLEAHDYQTSAHWSQIEGLELHYLLTGDELSRIAVGRVGDVFNVEFYMDNLGDLGAVMDNRIQARTLMALLTSWRINAPSQTGSQWATLLPQALTKILATQDAGGAYRFTRTDNQCGHNKPWMVGLLNDALIKYHSYFNADPRIPTAIQKSDDYMWLNDWDNGAKAFVYLDGPCPADEGGPAPDLNNLTVNGFAWIYRQTGNAVYRDRADQIFAGGVANAWLDGSKQFNQQYTSSYRYLAYRQ
jgi:hypothetical protein